MSGGGGAWKYPLLAFLAALGGAGFGGASADHGEPDPDIFDPATTMYASDLPADFEYTIIDEPRIGMTYPFPTGPTYATIDKIDTATTNIIKGWVGQVPYPHPECFARVQPVGSPDRITLLYNVTLVEPVIPPEREFFAIESVISSAQPTQEEINERFAILNLDFLGWLTGTYPFEYYCSTDPGGAYLPGAINKTWNLKVIQGVALPELIPSWIPDDTNLTLEAREKPFLFLSPTCVDPQSRLTNVESITEINSTKTGVQDLIFECTGSTGVSNQLTRKITVIDTTPPDLNLIGGSTATTQILGGEFDDPGFVCTDIASNPITVRTGFIDTKKVGNYTLTYTCTDGAMLQDVKTRIVRVGDILDPIIRIHGSKSILLEARVDTYVELGATCTNEDDQDLDVDIKSTVNTNIPGKYNVTYSCVDAAGNPAMSLRSVSVQDTTAPDITLKGKQEFTIEAGSEYEEDGARCLDLVDRIIEPDIIGGVNVLVPDVYLIRYECEDNSGNMGRKIRQVTVEDTTMPVLRLNGSALLSIRQNSTYADEGYRCFDIVDGNITDAEISVLPGGIVDTAIPDTYTVTYRCIDSSFNVASDHRQVTVQDNTPPRILLTGDNPIYVMQGTEYVDPESFCTDGGLGISDRLVSNATDIKTDEEGRFRVFYECLDLSMNPSNETRIVIVDGMSPTLVLNQLPDGITHPIIAVGAEYEDRGATCMDNFDPNPVQSDNSSDVSTQSAGMMQVLYTCTDRAGHAASAVRNVTVLVPALHIDLAGNKTVAHASGTAYDDLGASCTSNLHGEIIHGMLPDNTAIFTNDANLITLQTAPGEHTVTFTCQYDAIITTETRDVIVLHRSEPLIDIPGDTGHITGSPFDLLENSSCKGVTDSDLELRVLSINGDPAVTEITASATSGEYQVLYGCSEDLVCKSGYTSMAECVRLNVSAQRSRTINAADPDTSRPVIVPVDSPMYLMTGSLEPVITCDDDGTPIVVSRNATFHSDTDDDYTIRYECTDGTNYAVPLDVRYVIDGTLPQFSGSLVPLEYVMSGADYDSSALTCTDRNKPLIEPNVTLASLGEGPHPIRFDCMDMAGNHAEPPVDVIVFVDSVSPTPLPPDGVNLEKGDVFSASYTCRPDGGSPVTEMPVLRILNSTGDEVQQVDTMIPGSFEITYTCTDAAQNSGTSLAQTVRVFDRTAPILSGTAPTPNYLMIATDYSHTLTCDDGGTPGTILFDPGLESLTAEQEHTTTIYCPDESGNTANNQTVTIHVDATAPSFDGLGPVTLETGSTYAGFTCPQDSGTPVTTNPSVVRNSAGDIVTSVNTMIPGSYTVLHMCTDMAQNSATQSQAVEIVDTIAPILSGTAPSPAYEMIATDYAHTLTCDNGGTPGTILFDPTLESLTEEAEHTATIYCPDESGNTANNRTITIHVDSTDPEVAPPVVDLETGDTFVPFMCPQDGGTPITTNPPVIRNSSGIVDRVNTMIPGSYTAEYECFDMANNRGTGTQQISVTDSVAPVLSGTAPTPNYLMVATDYEHTLTCIDGNKDGIILFDPTLESLTEEAEHTTTIYCPDESGNTANNQTVIIHVDATAPSFDGLGPVTLETGSTYAGFTCPQDSGTPVATNTPEIRNSAGDIVASVDTMIPGSYTVLHMCTDMAQNSATQSQAVDVTDTIAPILSGTAPTPNYLMIATDYVHGLTCDNGGTPGTILFDPGLESLTAEQEHTTTIYCPDESGNTANNQTVIIHVDATAPSFDGLGPVTLETGSTYAGFTCPQDSGTPVTTNTPVVRNSAGDIVASVDTMIPGSYTVLHMCTDMAQNSATQSQAVDVTDTIAPILSGTAPSPAYEMIATDYSHTLTCDNGGTPGTILFDPGLESLTAEQEHTATIYCPDESGNTANNQTVIIHVDRTAPTVVPPGDVTLEIGDSFEPSLVCSQDGGSPVTEMSVPRIFNSTGDEVTEVSTAVTGSFAVRYECTDAAMNMGVSDPQNITVDDTTVPIIPNIESPIYLMIGAAEPDVTCDDAGMPLAVSQNVTFHSDTDDEYAIRYDCTDGTNNATPLHVRYVIDGMQPTLTLTPPNPHHVMANITYVDPGFDCNEGRTNLTGRVTSNSSLIDTEKEGRYTIQYTCPDLANNMINSTRSVIVDGTAPEITLNGEAEIFHDFGLPYEDPNAECLDDVDGTSTIAPAHHLNIHRAGIQDLIFECSDMAGNGAEQKSRRVTVLPPDSGGDDNDWQLNPTFGLSWGTNKQLVSDGFTFDGKAVDITDNFYTEFEQIEAEVGKNHTVTIKAYSERVLQNIVLYLGVPDLSRATDAESAIVLDVRRDYADPAGYILTSVFHEQDVPLVDEHVTVIGIAETECGSGEETCHEFSITFRVMAPLSHEIIAFSAIDTERRVTVTYINDGVLFAGESLLPPNTAVLQFKRGNQHPVETIHLAQQDWRYNVWSDQYGYAWIQNEYGSWHQLTQAGFERLNDPTVSVMTRSHSSFEDLVQSEQERAKLVFNSSSIESHVGESFSHDAPVRIDKLQDPIILEKLRIAELRALEYLGK